MTPRNIGVTTLLLLSAATVAMAEDITLTTYYPAPRGVYEEIRTTNNSYLASLVGSVGIGTANVPGAGKFAVAGTGQDPVGGVCPSGTDWYDENGNGARDTGECKPTGLYVAAVGNVGIGTTTPQFGRVMVEDAAVPMSFRETGVAVDAGGLWRMPLDGGILRFDVNTGAPGSEFGLNYHTPLAMTPAGNVGIGTANPGWTLTMADPVLGQPVLSLTTPGTVAGQQTDIHLMTLDANGNGRFDTGDKAWEWEAAGNATTGGMANQLILWKSGPVTSDRVMTFDFNTENVGIRTTNPRKPLDVNGEVVAVNRVTLAQDTGTTSATWHLDNSSGRFRIFDQPNISTPGTERFTITQPAGNVGIGITPSPAIKLHVAGSTQLDGNVSLLSPSISVTKKTVFSPDDTVQIDLGAYRDLEIDASNMRFFSVSGSSFGVTDIDYLGTVGFPGDTTLYLCALTGTGSVCNTVKRQTCCANDACTTTVKCLTLP